MAKTAENSKWSEDELGVISWKGFGESGTWQNLGHDPFYVLLGAMKLSRVSEDHKMAYIFTHDDLDAARAIALSIFGKHWREHTMDVYDRLKAQRQEFEKKSEEETRRNQYHEEAAEDPDLL